MIALSAGSLLGACQPRVARPNPVAPSDAIREEGEEIHYPTVFWFRCLDSTFDPALRDNGPILEELGVILATGEPVARVRLEGHQSVSGPERARGPELSLERARSVAAQLAPRFVERQRIETVGLGWGASYATEFADPCPAPEEDIGFPGRRVEVIVVRYESGSTD